MTRIFPYIFCGVAALWLAAGSVPSAVAQTGKRLSILPPVDFGKVVPPSVPEDITGAVPDSTSSIHLYNPYLKDTLILQHQIGLLERLIERQTVISQIESAYSEIGLPFRAQPPPREICEQLPPSIPCSRGYPDLAGGGMPDISIDAADLLPEIPLPEVVPVPVPSESQEKVPEKYSWAEVSCAGKSCKAVLVETDNPVVRKTVVSGEVLPDGSTVSAISFDGVLVSRDGKAIPLEPAKAPSRGGPSSPVLGGGVATGGYVGGTVQPAPSSPVASGAFPENPSSANRPVLPAAPALPSVTTKGSSPTSAGLPTP